MNSLLIVVYCCFSSLAFKSAKEKVNCWICGLVVHVSCVTYQPFPARYNDDLTTLKDKPSTLFFTKLPHIPPEKLTPTLSALFRVFKRV